MAGLKCASERIACVSLHQAIMRSWIQLNGRGARKGEGEVSKERARKETEGDRKLLASAFRAFGTCFPYAEEHAIDLMGVISRERSEGSWAHDCARTSEAPSELSDARVAPEPLWKGEGRMRLTLPCPRIRSLCFRAQTSCSSSCMVQAKCQDDQKGEM